jgi:hypothetical protein
MESQKSQTTVQKREPSLDRVNMKSIREILRSHAEFDIDGRHIGGTDKQSNHNYGDAYESLFLDMSRRNVSLMMEVGVADGASMLAWRDVFPNATIVGMDIHEAKRVLNVQAALLDCGVKGTHLEFHIGDQRVHRDCERAANGRLFDLIVDDATHNLEDTLRTFFYLWPHVRPIRGLYVVEEFPNIGEFRNNITQMWPFAEIVDTAGPFGGVEPLVVFRKLP